MKWCLQVWTRKIILTWLLCATLLLSPSKTTPLSSQVLVEVIFLLGLLFSIIRRYFWRVIYIFETYLSWFYYMHRLMRLITLVEVPKSNAHGVIPDLTYITGNGIWFQRTIDWSGATFERTLVRSEAILSPQSSGRWSSFGLIRGHFRLAMSDQRQLRAHSERSRCFERTSV